MSSLKALVFFAGLLIPLTAGADSMVCSQYVARDAKMARALEFLRRYEGSYTLGKCQIELQVCGEISVENDRGEMVADLLIVDERGREFYAPIYFLRSVSDRFWFELRNGRIMLHYRYEDRLPNPYTSGVESIHLEILSEWDDPALNVIQMGYYLKKDYIEKNRKHRYQWVHCE